MKPPLARPILVFVALLATVVLLCFAPGEALAANPLAADVGQVVPQSLSGAKLAGLIALGLLPAVFMVARARQTRTH